MKKKQNKSRKNKNFIEIYGLHAVKAALKNNKRIHHQLIISRTLLHNFKNFEHKVSKIITLPNNELSKIYGNEKNHQGVILKTSRLKQPKIDDIIYQSKQKKSELVIMLDQITDPQNIGSIMRSCALFNCQSIIVSKRNCPDITSSMAKAASGSLEIINYIKVANLSRVIEKFKKNKFWVVGFDNSKYHTDEKILLPKKCLLVFGSENKGLRELTKKECDHIIKIKINSNNQYGIESLNVANACTIALYEHFKNNN